MKLQLTIPHDLPAGSYDAVWSSDSLQIERPEVGLTTVIGIRGRREGVVIASSVDRMSVEFVEVQS